MGETTFAFPLAHLQRVFVLHYNFHFFYPFTDPERNLGGDPHDTFFLGPISSIYHNSVELYTHKTLTWQ